MCIVNKKVKLSLVGVDGNIFALMGAFSKQARKEKWTKAEIDSILNACMASGSYDEAVGIMLNHSIDNRPVDVEDEDDDDMFDVE